MRVAFIASATSIRRVTVNRAAGDPGRKTVAWGSGEAISGTTFRHMIKAADTGGRFSPGQQYRER
jgi:hypothetical protein